MPGHAQSTALSAASTPSRERSIAPALGRIYDAHQVNSNHSITFRIDAPNARRVELVTDIVREVLPLSKGPDGLWSLTTPPLPPALYAYAFSVDGVDHPDPRNPWIKPNLVSNASLVLIPGTPAQPWEMTAIPHGTVHSHVYTTSVVTGLPANQSRYVVYTPPGYDAHAGALYPVLYLLHGWSDSENSWTQIGQAHLILDALIASGQAKPMVVVMPLGYGQMSFVEAGIGVWKMPPAISANATHFQRALMNEILPQVQSTYNIRQDREGRAIVGQSMGGLASLLIGLNHTDQFAWIGGFSSAVSILDNQQAPGFFENLNPATAKLSLVWLGCGVEDPLLTPNRNLILWLKQQGLSITEAETPGGHAWPVWRENLVDFASLLFQNY
jgi:enterochelin esterase-like enzyme